ncbi:DEAD/DEAH box helicase family protein [Natrialba sp. PRR66]|uniref:DEAD/DEAH box helicase family protein n=1 Tax=Natrialba sp. PRR66 TaxID=3098146 RepID=UPI002B1D4DED|nr:DEAD/DEAH box helicase family protein [Natrialba sp. PRR66]
MYLSPRPSTVTRTSDTLPVELHYEDGTVRLPELDPATAESLRRTVPDSELERDPRTDGWRAPAFRYAALRRGLAALETDSEANSAVAIDDRVLDLPALSASSSGSDSDSASASDPVLHSAYELRAYQREALTDWLETDRWADVPAPGDDGPLASARAPAGVLELPTGSGKTVIALAAIERLSVPTLVVVPTIDLLEQWERELEREFNCPIGRFGGGEQRLEPITVSTYDSAYLKADSVGDRFGFVVFDEVHHLGGEGYRDIARLLAAPARLGLTATFERPDEAHEIVAEIVGPLVHRVAVDELAGDHLAAYDLKRLEVSLTPAERAAYDEKQQVFADYLARSNIRMQSGSDYRELVKRSGNDPDAREALLARQRAREIARGSEAKLDALQGILDDHRDDRIIIFTAYNDLAYDVSERFLVPTITHQTGAAERREILDRFRDGTYSRIATSNVLDEGVDVPDANVAVVLSGSGSEREFTQRLGRVLRPKSDGSRALLYEVISSETGEENVAERRR